MSDVLLAATLPSAFPPNTRPTPPPTDPELFAVLESGPRLFVAVDAVELGAAAADGDLGDLAVGGAAVTQEAEEVEEIETPFRESFVTGDAFVRVLEAATETRLRREDGAGLDAAGAPTRLRVPGVGRVAVVCPPEGIRAEEEDVVDRDEGLAPALEEGVCVEVAADLGERKVAAAASSFSRRIL